MKNTLFTHNQQVALALLPKVSGFFSMISSVWIVVEVLKETSKRSNVYHRLMCGMSIWVSLISASMFLSTWPMPTNNGEDGDNTVWYVLDFFLLWHLHEFIFPLLISPVMLEPQGNWKQFNVPDSRYIHPIQHRPTDLYVYEERLDTDPENSL